MKQHIALAALMLAAGSAALAGPGAFFGVVYNFGGSVGVSAKILSTNKENRAALEAGVSYFPLTNQFGIDAGAAYLGDDAAGTLGWDFLNNNVQVGGGYVNTRKHNDAPAPVVVPDVPR